MSGTWADRAEREMRAERWERRAENAKTWAEQAEAEQEARALRQESKR